MAVIATLTPSPIPAGDVLGGLPMVLYHVQINPAGGAGTYLFAHGLPYTPTFVYIAKVLTEGTAPAATDMAVPCYADVGATNIGVNVGSNGLFDVFYG